MTCAARRQQFNKAKTCQAVSASAWYEQRQSLCVCGNMHKQALTTATPPHLTTGSLIPTVHIAASISITIIEPIFILIPTASCITTCCCTSLRAAGLPCCSGFGG